MFFNHEIEPNVFVTNKELVIDGNRILHSQIQLIDVKRHWFSTRYYLQLTINNKKYNFFKFKNKEACWHILFAWCEFKSILPMLEKHKYA